MKKERILIFSIILLLIIVSQVLIIPAQTAPGLEILENDSLLGTVQTGTEKAGEFQAAENKSDFLKAQWGEILAKNTLIGPILRFFDKISPFTDPVFRYTVGLEPSFTWLFALTIIIFITFLSYMHAFLEYSTFSEKTRWIISLCLTIILGVSKLYVIISQKIIALLTLISSTWWAQLIAIAIAIVVLVLLIILSKNTEKVMKQLREKEKAKKMERELETVEAKLEGTEKVAEIFEKK